jgi:dihydroorotase
MRLVFFCLLSTVSLLAQPYDILLKGGHVMDPANGIDAVMDVAVAGDRIASVRAGLPPDQARTVLDVTGLYVVPGLIDLHMHVFGNDSHLFPDDTALPTGTTTIVDAGGSGWKTFDNFRRGVISHSRTRVLALLNILGNGMIGAEGEQSDITDMDPAKTAETIQRNRDVIVGIKTAHFGGQGWTAIDRAREAGRIANVPIMVDDKIFTNTGRTTREKVLDHLRPGDIHTHMYNDRQMELLDRFTGKVQPYMLDARNRGVKFDMGHGAGSFLWTVASKAAAQGFLPDTISTDLHTASILAGQPDMPNCMSKMMLLGMSLADAVVRSTVNPAKEISRFPEIGTLGAGRVADIAVLDLETGVFAYKDAWGVKKLGTQRLENAMTIRAGKLVYRRDGRVTATETAIYDILLKNGQVIDPANRRNGRFDVAVVGNKIAKVGRDLPAAHARIAIDAGQYYVTPGLIDIQGHFDAASGGDNLQADHNCLPYGVTTAGPAKPSAGQKTRLLEFKVATPDAGPSPLQPGDIVTHLYRNPPAPWMTGARQRGVLFDADHGSQCFSFEVARQAIREGHLPDTISTGLDASSVLEPGVNMMAVLSRYVNLSLNIEQLVELTTANPARAIHHPELGTLSEGAVADIALIALERGVFEYRDSSGGKLAADRRLRCVLTVRDGAIVWDSDGLSAPDTVKAGPYSNFK